MSQAATSARSDPETRGPATSWRRRTASSWRGHDLGVLGGGIHPVEPAPLEAARRRAPGEARSTGGAWPSRSALVNQMIGWRDPSRLRRQSDSVFCHLPEWPCPAQRGNARSAARCRWGIRGANLPPNQRPTGLRSLSVAGRRDADPPICRSPGPRSPLRMTPRRRRSRKGLEERSIAAEAAGDVAREVRRRDEKPRQDRPSNERHGVAPAPELEKGPAVTSSASWTLPSVRSACRYTRSRCRSKSPANTSLLPAKAADHRSASSEVCSTVSNVRTRHSVTRRAFCTRRHLSPTFRWRRPRSSFVSGPGAGVSGQVCGVRG